MSRRKIIYEELTAAELDYFVSFWRGGMGRAYGFRFEVEK
jgi:hypothetical protein